MTSTTCLRHYQTLLSSLSLIGAKISKLLPLSGQHEQTRELPELPVVPALPKLPRNYFKHRANDV